MAVATANQAAAQSDRLIRSVSRRARARAALEDNAFVVSILAACLVMQAVVIRGAVVFDAWYTVLGGRIVLHSGLPRTDTLTVLTLGHHWVDQQWLGQLALYGAWAAGGWVLAGLAVMALYGGAFLIAALSARALGASDRSAAVVLLAGFVTGLPNTVFRTQTLAYPLFAVVLALLLTDARRPSRRVYLVLPVLVLWANVHGSVVLGAGLVSLLGLAWAWTGLRARRPVREWLPRAVALIVLPWLCALASPYGAALPRYYRSVLDNPTLAHSVSEWAPSTLRGQPVFFAALAAGLVLAVRSRTALTPFARLALAASAIGGLLAVRGEVWFALTAAAVLPAALDAWWAPGARRGRSRLNLGLALGGLAVAATAFLAVVRHGAAWFVQDYPARAAATVESATSADRSLRVFADERYADWLLFEDPRLAGRVAYDLRFELLGSKQLASLVAFRTEHGLDWPKAADGYGLLVLDPASDRGAVRLYERQAGAMVLYRDRNVVVIRRPAS
jgi:hypothetical protein